MKLTHCKSVLGEGWKDEYGFFFGEIKSFYYDSTILKTHYIVHEDFHQGEYRAYDPHGDLIARRFMIELDDINIDMIFMSEQEEFLLRLQYGNDMFIKDPIIVPDFGL